MWLAGVRQILGDGSVWASVKDLALARWFIGVGVWIGLVVAFFLVYRIFAFWPAMAIWAFLALNPFFLAQSRRVHTDALATVFIFLTILLFILYCISPKQRSYLIFSGIVFGLACLTKSYSLIILLWGPVCLLLFRQYEHTWRKFFFHALLSGILFLNCTLITIFALWPIFWTPLFGLRGICLLGAIYLLTHAKGRHRTIHVITAGSVLVAVGFFALRTMWGVFSGVEWAVTTAHEVEHFFLGKALYDPGWLFYPFALSIKSTPFTIPFAIFGVFWLWKRRKEKDLSGKQLKIVFSLICCILLFTLCLSVTAKKFSRYLLPVFSMIDLLAGLGLFYATKGVGSWFKTILFQQVGQIIFCILIFALTAVPVFVLHPAMVQDHCNTHSIVGLPRTRILPLRTKSCFCPLFACWCSHRLLCFRMDLRFLKLSNTGRVRHTRRAVSTLTRKLHACSTSNPCNSTLSDLDVVNRDLVGRGRFFSQN